jgi:transposase
MSPVCARRPWQAAVVPAGAITAPAVVRDQQAVTAGLALPCSSAAMEGNVHRMITMIKRQMCGRAAFPSCASA